MTRTLKLEGERIIASASEVVIELGQREVAILALELMLLLRGLSDLVCVFSRDIKVELRVAPDSSVPTAFSRTATGRTQCSLSKDNAEYLEATLLRAYRDGMAEVNHIHLGGQLGGEHFDLTLLFDTARPPMTPEEAEKLMGP